ncbi:hypothetical protein RUND412_006429 [Rhizina undulata]
MQFNFVALTVAALVASAAAATNTTHSGNGTNATTSYSPSAPSDSTGAAFQNAVSGGLLGAVVAAGFALVSFHFDILHSLELG